MVWLQNPKKYHALSNNYSATIYTGDHFRVNTMCIFDSQIRNVRDQRAFFKEKVLKIFL